MTATPTAEPVTGSKTLGVVTVIAFVIFFVFAAFSVHSCIYNPEGPDEFSVGYAPTI